MMKQPSVRYQGRRNRRKIIENRGYGDGVVKRNVEMGKSGAKEVLKKVLEKVRERGGICGLDNDVPIRRRV